MVNKYNLIHESLQDKIDSGEITLEDAEKVDNLAYEKYADTYLKESEDDDEEMLNDLASAVKDGKVKLSADDRKCIKELLDGASEDSEGNEEEAKDEESDGTDVKESFLNDCCVKKK